MSPNQTCPVLRGCSQMKLKNGHKNKLIMGYFGLVWFGMTIHKFLVDLSLLELLLAVNFAIWDTTQKMDIANLSEIVILNKYT